MLPLSQLPENPCCYSTGQCCSPLRTARARKPFSCSRSFVRRTIFWNLEFWSKTPKRSFFGPLLLRHWCTNPCCSTTAQFVFLVRVARYANHFSSLLGSPKIPFCWVQFLSSRTSRMRLIFCSHSAQLPENPCCYSTGQCCSPLRTARTRTRFPALVRSSVEPFFGISNFGQKRQNAPFLGRCCSATGAPIHAAYYYCPVCLPSEKIHAAIVQASAAHHCELQGLGTVFLLSFVRPGSTDERTRSRKTVPSNVSSQW